MPNEVTTPRPWRARILRAAGHPPTIEILAGKKAPVVGWQGFDDCDTGDSEHEANARLIVACVNHADDYARLVKAAREMRDRYRDAPYDVVDRLNAALAPFKNKGELNARTRGKL